MFSVEMHVWGLELRSPQTKPGGPRLGHASWTSQEPGPQAGPAQGSGGSNPRVSVCVCLFLFSRSKPAPGPLALQVWLGWGQVRNRLGFWSNLPRPTPVPRTEHTRLTPWQWLMARFPCALYEGGYWLLCCHHCGLRFLLSAPVVTLHR